MLAWRASSHLQLEWCEDGRRGSQAFKRKALIFNAAFVNVVETGTATRSTMRSRSALRGRSGWARRGDPGAESVGLLRLGGGVFPKGLRAEGTAGKDGRRTCLSFRTTPPARSRVDRDRGNNRRNGDDPGRKCKGEGSHRCSRPSREEPEDGKAYSSDHVSDTGRTARGRPWSFGTGPV